MVRVRGRVTVAWRLVRAAAMGAGHEAMQDGQDVLAVFAGGVDAAADVEPVLGGVFAGQAAGDLLLGLRGRTPRSLMLLVGQIRVSVQNRRTSAWRWWQNSCRVPNLVIAADLQCYRRVGHGH